MLGAWSKVPMGILELLQAFVYGGLESGTEQFSGSLPGISDRSPTQEVLWMDSGMPQHPGLLCSLPALVFAFPSPLSSLHLLPQAEAAQVTSLAHLYPYLQDINKATAGTDTPPSRS